MRNRAPFERAMLHLARQDLGACPVDRVRLGFVFIRDERLVVSAAIEHPADFDITGRQHHVDDDDTPLESEDANTRAKVVPQSADFRECL
jgi:hypothetical protein